MADSSIPSSRSPSTPPVSAISWLWSMRSCLNGIELDYTQEELSGVILSLAAGEIGHGELLRWVIEHQE